MALTVASQLFISETLLDSTCDSTNTVVPALMNKAGDESPHFDKTSMSVSALSLRHEGMQAKTQMKIKKKKNGLGKDSRKLCHK